MPVREFLGCFYWSEKTHPKNGSNIPLPYLGQIQRKSEKAKLLVFFFFLACLLVMLANSSTSTSTDVLQDIRTQPLWASNGYPRILQASGTRLGLLRHLASWTEQLLDFLALQCEATIIWLPSLYHICNLIIPYTYIYIYMGVIRIYMYIYEFIYSFCSSRVP